jgi:hypothetical protein
MTPMPPCRKAGPVMSTVPQASSKVSAAHLRRGAYLYVRQSTIKQVLTNTESTLRQYDLRGRAIAFGWSSDQIIITGTGQATPAPPPPTGKDSSSWSPTWAWARPG